MKKIVSIFLCLALLCALAGCVIADDTTKSTNASSGSQAASTNASSDSQAASTNSTAVSTPPAFQEQVVVDNEYCTIKITDIDPDNLFGYTLKVYLENKSPDTTYMMAVESASINGVQADPFFATEVAPGKKANGEISFTADFAQGHEIGSYTDIALSFQVYDTNDWLAEPVATPSIHIYPLGQEQATTFSRLSVDSDLVLVDNEQVTVTVIGYRTDAIWGYTVDLYLVNKTDTTVMFSVDEVSVNGFMLDPFYADSVGPALCAFSSISWFEEDFEANDITTVENIEFLLSAYDEENWLDDDFVNEKIILTP